MAKHQHTTHRVRANITKMMAEASLSTSTLKAQGRSIDRAVVADKPTPVITILPVSVAELKRMLKRLYRAGYHMGYRYDPQHNPTYRRIMKKLGLS